MKRSELVDELERMREQAFFLRSQASSLEEAAAGIEATCERLTRALNEKPAAAPTQIEYDRARLDAPPTPKQGSMIEPPLCKCGDTAKRIEKVGRNEKPYVAYACPNPKSEGCDFWVFENQLKQTA